MNERIEEFAELTGAVRYDFDTLDGTNLEELNKFAQLIVQECANMAESFHRHQYDFTGNLELHEFIKIHFGVEA